MKSKIFAALKDNILYVVLAVLILAAAILGVAVNSEKNEKIIIHSDSKPSTEQSSEDVSEIVTTVSVNSKEKSQNSDKETKQTAKVISEADAKSPKEDIQFPLDINLATAEQLTKINGIGEVTADKIIAYRDSIGVIYNMDLLLEISGIGERTLDLLKEYLYVSEYDYREIFSENTDTTETELPADNYENEDEQDYHELPSEPEPEPVMQRVNVNTAGAEEISQKLLIDIELAERIVELREEIHGFSNMLELLYAEGMSENLLAKLQDYIEI